MYTIPEGTANRGGFQKHGLSRLLCPSSCIPLVFIFGRSEIIEFHEAYSRLQILSNFLPFLSMLYHISCDLHSMNSLRELPILSLVYHVSCDPHSLSFVREQPILETSQSCS